ncbi:putative RNA-directed DNA polymerase from transposon X-element [Trichonephila inaurata madagascariensis]|uniref:Putative RNA-directed DNA polymerase from transposon X-element n=1 Tax=Trichonephila inaurata madagascariensis TaxID=2747483 RepID=A0A8X6X9Y5_9ARAC|nr:putative RNA-directed DNA polymerase from transposon X-element [Trichonephila inaurata madagascariensis]
MNNTPAPPKVNFWEQRANNAAARQQPNPITSKKFSQATPSTTNTSTEPAIDIFEQLNSPAIIINNNSFETTAIKLNRQNDLPVTIVCAYHPPRKPITVQDLHQIFQNRGHVLVAGDLNAKHTSWSPLTQQNTPGHIIRRFCDSTGYSLIAPPEPTRFHRNRRSTTIDIAICKVMTVTDCSSIPDLSSDHNPVLFEVSLDNFISSALSPYSFPNWYKFQEILINPFQEIQEFSTLSI